MNKIQALIISINFILFSLVSSFLTHDDRGYFGLMILFLPFVLKIKFVLKTSQTKVFNYVLIVLLSVICLRAMHIYSKDFYSILQVLFVVGILYFQLDAFAYFEYKKVYGSSTKTSTKTSTSTTSTSTTSTSTTSTKTSKDFFVECVNCGEKNKNPTTDLCTKCGKSISNKSLTVKCTNCGGEFDSKESNCPYCATTKA